MKHTNEYLRYLQSAAWRKKRINAIAQAHGQCSRCRRVFIGGVGLEVHHKTYERLGDERLTDLEVVCVKCHPKADEDRRADVQWRQHSRRAEAWAQKRYGENWDRYKDADQIADEFDDWLDRRGYE